MKYYTRSDDGDKDGWPSAKYIANKIGLKESDVQQWLDGPALSRDNTLEMTEAQAELFCKSNMTRKAELGEQKKDATV